MAIKDIQNNTELTNYSVRGSDANMSVSPFGHNRAAELAYKKVERLVLATHLVTNYVPESEYVRERVRKNSQELLPLVMALREGLQSGGPANIAGVLAHVRQVLSLLDILHASQYISDMNLDVLKGAYADFARFLERSVHGSAAESVALDDDYFAAEQTVSQGQKSKGHTTSVKDISITDTVKDTPVVKDMKAETGKRSQSLRVKRRTTNRRVMILDIVTKKSPIHVKELATEMPDCSGKTIQRELAALVRDGVLKKSGLKRWTQYSLVA